jgi:hypothetical protein
MSSFSSKQFLSACFSSTIHTYHPYSLIEADAVFHNVSVEQTIARYLIAKLQEVSSLQ